MTALPGNSRGLSMFPEPAQPFIFIYNLFLSFPGNEIVIHHSLVFRVKVGAVGRNVTADGRVVGCHKDTVAFIGEKEGQLLGSGLRRVLGQFGRRIPG